MVNRPDLTMSERAAKIHRLAGLLAKARPGEVIYGLVQPDSGRSMTRGK